jgi:hypothetical protein
LDSNEMNESDWQNEKHSEQRISTLGGITINWRDEDDYADDSIRVDRELDSIEIEWKRPTLEKGLGPLFEIDSEIQVRIIPDSSSFKNRCISSIQSTEPSRTTSRRS